MISRLKKNTSVAQNYFQLNLFKKKLKRGGLITQYINEKAFLITQGMAFYDTLSATDPDFICGFFKSFEWFFFVLLIESECCIETAGYCA